MNDMANAPTTSDVYLPTAGVFAPAPASAAPAAARRLPRLEPGMAGIRLTPEEFDAIEDYDDCYDYELVDGVVVVNPIPLEGEVGPNEFLGHLLLTYQETASGAAQVVHTLPERYIPTFRSRRRADRVIWAGLGRRPNPKVDLPTIVVEFVSKSRRDWLRDYIEKRDEYLALGVREYWIIDRFRRTMTVFRPAAASAESAGAPASAAPAEQPSPTEGESAAAPASEQLVLAEQGTYATPLLPGFELPLARLLDVADEWSQAADAEDSISASDAPGSNPEGNP